MRIIWRDRSSAHACVIARRLRRAGLGRSWRIRRDVLRGGTGRVSCYRGRIVLGFLRSFRGFCSGSLGEIAGLHFGNTLVDLLQRESVALLFQLLLHAREAAE